MVSVGRDLKAHPVPNPAMGWFPPHQLRLPRTPFSLALGTSRDGAPQQSGQQHQGLTILAGKSFTIEISQS